MTSRYSCTTGARKPTTSFPPNSLAPELRALHRNLSTGSWSPPRQPRGDRSRARHRNDHGPGNSFTHADRNNHLCQAIWLRLGSRACQLTRHTWSSHRSAVAARCLSNHCGPRVWQANPASSSNTCLRQANRRSRGSWFDGVEDDSILRLLDPLDEGKPDLAPPEIWRDYIRTVGRTPNGIWGGKLMWNQTPLLLQRAAGLPDRSGDGLLSAIRDVIGSDPVLVHVYRPDVVSQAVSFWRAVQTRVWRGRPDPTRDSRVEYHAAAIAHVVTLMREQEKGLAGVVR